MNAFIVPFLVAATLLVVSGVLKTTRPERTVGALVAVGLPGPSWLVRGLGAAEVGVGTGALVWGTRPWGVLVAGSYTAFAAFVALARHRGTPLSSCGCFGVIDTPPTILHLVVNIVFTAAGAAVVAGAPAGIPSVVEAQPAVGVTTLLLAGVGTYLCFLVLTRLAQLQSLMHREP